MRNVENTIEFIKEAHKGQKYGNMPYWLHPVQVMFNLPEDASNDAKIIALLHDVIEDTHHSDRSLIELGYSRKIVTAVQMLTSRHDVSYHEYIQQIIDSGDKNAIQVKLADNLTNSDPKNLVNLKPCRRERLEHKYAISIEMLTQALDQ